MKACGVCGGVRRYKNGQCAACSQAATRRYQQSVDAQSLGPCGKCGAASRNRWGQCKPCKNAYSRKRRAKLDVATLPPCKICGGNKRYASGNCKICASEAQKRSAQNNAEKPCVKCGSVGRNAYGGCLACTREIGRAWVRANPDKVKAANQRRRARVRAAEGRITAREIAQKRNAQRGRCAFCGADLAKGEHLDHIIPLIAGGGNDPSNIQLLCPPCNLSKGTKDPFDFAQERGRLL